MINILIKVYNLIFFITIQILFYVIFSNISLNVSNVSLNKIKKYRFFFSPIYRKLLTNPNTLCLGILITTLRQKILIATVITYGHISLPL